MVVVRKQERCRFFFGRLRFRLLTKPASTSRLDLDDHDLDDDDLNDLDDDEDARHISRRRHVSPRCLRRIQPRSPGSTRRSPFVRNILAITPASGKHRSREPDIHKTHRRRRGPPWRLSECRNRPSFLRCYRRPWRLVRRRRLLRADRRHH